MKTNLQKDIQAWAKRTVEAYIEMAKKWDYSFYTQSPLTQIDASPQYFIIQINPGSGGTYTQQKKNIGHDMTPQGLLEGNPVWDRHAEWGNFRNLRSLFSQIEGGNPLDDDRNFILTNASFFNTVKATGDIYQTIPQTLPLTLELAEIVKPQHIVVLGSNLHHIIKQFGGNVSVEPTQFPRIKKGHIHGIETIYIDHPSYYRYSKQDTRQLLKRWHTMPLAQALQNT